MKNRAKCKLCSSIIEVKNETDIFSCSCGEVSLDTQFGHCHASIKSDPSNLLMVDDEGNEIIPTRKRDDDAIEDVSKLSKKDLLNMLDEMKKHIDDLPQHAQHAPVTHSDLASVLSLLSLVFRSA